MPRTGPLQTNRRAVLTAIDSTNGGDYRINYGGNTATAPTTSFWQFAVTGTSTFNLNRVNSGGTSLNAINVIENGNARFTGANGFVEIQHGGSGGIGIDIVNSGSVASYLDFRMAGGDADYDFRFIEQNPTTLVVAGQTGALVSFSPATQFAGGLTSLTAVALASDTAGVGIIRYLFGSSLRWDIGRNDAAESGGASGRTGSNFFIGSWNNSGADGLIPFEITRADSRTTLLAGGYRSGAFTAFHNQTALTANRTVTWPNLDGRVVLQPDTAVTDGQLLIGNTSTGAFARTTLTAGTGVTVTNGSGTVTVATSGNFGDIAVSRYSITNNAQSGTTYTLQASDNGLQVICTNASAITVTVPSGLPTGFNCLIVQGGAGQVTIAAGASVTLQQRQSMLRLAGQHAVASVLPTPTANTYRLTGDLTT